MESQEKQAAGTVFRISEMGHTDVVFFRRPKNSSEKWTKIAHSGGAYDYVSYWTDVKPKSLNLVISKYKVPLYDAQHSFDHRGSIKILAGYGYVYLKEKTNDVCKRLGHGHPHSRSMIDEKNNVIRLLERQILDEQCLKGYLAKNLDSGLEFFISEVDFRLTEHLTE